MRIFIVFHTLLVYPTFGQMLDEMLDQHFIQHLIKCWMKCLIVCVWWNEIFYSFLYTFFALDQTTHPIGQTLQTISKVSWYSVFDDFNTRSNTHDQTFDQMLDANISSNIWSNVGWNVWSCVGKTPLPSMVNFVGSNIWSNVGWNVGSNIWSNVGWNVWSCVGPLSFLQNHLKLLPE